MKEQKANRKRKNRVEVRLNDDEFKNLCRWSQACAVDHNKYIRMLLSHKHPVEHPPVAYEDFMREVRKLGVSMNQLAVKAHALGFIDEPEYRRNAQAIWKLCADIRGAFAKGGVDFSDYKDLGGETSARTADRVCEQ